MSRAQFRGDLSERSLDEILFTIQRHDVPGVLKATRGSVEKRLYVRDRTLVHASSSDRSESLGRFLVSQGGVSEKLMGDLRSRVGKNRRLGGELISEGVLSPAEVKDALRGQIETLLWPLFSWSEGKVTFEVGDFEDPVPPTVHLPIRRLIKEAYRRHPKPLELISRMGLETCLERAEYDADELLEIELDAQEFQLLSMVDGGTSVRELCRLGPLSPAENGKLIYAFGALKLVKQKSEEDFLDGVLDVREEWISAGSEPEAGARESNTESRGPFRWTVGPPSMGRLD